MKKDNYLQYLFLLMTINFIQGQIPENDPLNWDLIVNDNFDSLSHSFWSVPNCYDHRGYPHRERQIYTNHNRNVRTENGNLILQTHAENYSCNSISEEFTSGWIQSNGKYGFGYYEIECKMPIGNGLWPAFWLARPDSNTPLPRGQEIDIFEVLGEDPSDITGGHWYKVDQNYGHKIFHFVQPNINSGDWHRYGLEWTPQSLSWYVDGILVANTTKKIPQHEMQIILNLALKPYSDDPSSNIYPSIFEINYFRYWKRKNGLTYPSWSENWVSNFENSFSAWNLNQGDKFIVGDFDGDSLDELLTINPLTKYAKIQEYNGFDWVQKWTNQGNGKIGLWNLNEGDKYIAGDFDGDGFDDLIMINYYTNYSMLYNFKNNTWNRSYSNIGNQTIGDHWVLGENDRYVVGNLHLGNNSDEIIFISTDGSWNMLNYEGGSWNSLITNTALDSRIGSWAINPTDKFVSGDFLNNGHDNILCINPANGFCKTITYNGADSWSTNSTNGGSGNIDGWAIKSDDYILAGDFDNNNISELLLINKNGYTNLRYLDDSQWKYIWSNSGNLNNHNWNVYPQHNDLIINGLFSISEPETVFVSRNSGIQDPNYNDGNHPISDQNIRTRSYKLIPSTISSTSQESNFYDKKIKDYQDIFIYPNPNNDGILHFSSEIEELKIISINGKSLDYGFINEYKSIKINDINKGVYFVRYKKNNKTGVCKLIVR